MRARITLLLAFTACGPVTLEAPPDRSVQAIVGGTVAPNDGTVFALGSTLQGQFCTATLIGERTLLTAAHCVNGFSALQASNDPDVRTWPMTAIDVVERREHPRWDQGYDVAMLLLATAPPVAPKPWNRVPVRMSTIPMVRAVGYGDTKTPEGAGVRYQASVLVTAVNDTIIFLGNGATPTTCFGDSGGPSFATAPDGIERVVGVHAFSTSFDCTGGGDIRVDAVADFIDTWTREKAPTCATDAACVTENCATPDLDCFCLADGMCDSQCPLPDTDEDCPRHCLADEVCAYGACGVPDPDCKKDGDDCDGADLCSGHQCLSDAQHSQPYCSRTCVASSQCNAAMRCSFGLCRYPVLPVVGMGDPCEVGATLCSNGICGGQSVATTVCRIACGANDFCPGSLKCVGGVGGVTYCQAPATFELMPGELPSAQKGCSATGGSALALAALLWLISAGRRRTG